MIELVIAAMIVCGVVVMLYAFHVIGEVYRAKGETAEAIRRALGETDD